MGVAALRIGRDFDGYASLLPGPPFPLFQQGLSKAGTPHAGIDEDLLHLGHPSAMVQKPLCMHRKMADKFSPFIDGDQVKIVLTGDVMMEHLFEFLEGDLRLLQFTEHPVNGPEILGFCAPEHA